MHFELSEPSGQPKAAAPVLQLLKNVERDSGELGCGHDASAVMWCKGVGVMKSHD